MLSAYSRPEGRYDELLEAPGKPRAHWSRLYTELIGNSPAHIRERLAAAEHQIRESGITYNVYADPQGHDRQWDLDVLPLIIPPQEWAQLQSGIAQRAELFNRILADLYGVQNLLKEGLIPASLVYRHRGFLRPAHGMRVPNDTYLHIYGADLARSADGRWWVMADRTQAPSGAGYALENRLIVSSTFPALFRDLHVERLARFFAGLRDSLVRQAPRGDGPTLTVLLTPGPYNETYFEHAFLARYLGFPLVEGGDLTVRDAKVWLKTIDGLKRVHAIIRRQDDDYCDPLELRADSALGVPGLTDCARRGNVLLANALGSGVLESDHLLGFLPRVCEHLMGEPLRLPSIATWWCGEPAAFEDAFEHVENVVFKSADPMARFEPIFGQDLDRTGVEKLRQRIAANPERFVAQEFVRMSQAPVLVRGQTHRLTGRGIGLRVFAAAGARGYQVMPGGLTRVASSTDARVVSMQRGGGSKDTWVTSASPVDASLTLLRTTVTAQDLVRSGAGISSRVAENLFWFGRYAERSDNAARLLRVAINPAQQDKEDAENTEAPVRALARAFGILGADEDADEGLLAAATLETNAYGLAANLGYLARVAFNLRDRMSLDNWRTINHLVQDPAYGRSVSLAETLGWLDRTIGRMMTLSGFALDGMTRDNGWRFLSIGRRLERLTFQCLALNTAFAAGLRSGLTWLLELADSSVTYRSRYLSRPEWLPVLDLLILDAANPRSLLFQAKGIHDYLTKLEEAHGPCGREAFLPHLQALQNLDAGDLLPENARLREAVSALRGGAFTVGDQLTQRFFTHARGTSWATLGL